MADVVWEKNKLNMPTISGYVPFYEFHYATLKFIIYKVEKINELDRENDVAECYISFVKLLGFESSSIISKDKT